MPGTLPSLFDWRGAGEARELHPVSHPPPAPLRCEGGGAGYASTRLWLATERNMHWPARHGRAVLLLLPWPG